MSVAVNVNAVIVIAFVEFMVLLLHCNFKYSVSLNPFTWFICTTTLIPSCIIILFYTTEITRIIAIGFLLLLWLLFTVMLAISLAHINLFIM